MPLSNALPPFLAHRRFICANGGATGCGGAGLSVFIGELGADAALAAPEPTAEGLSLAFPFSLASTACTLAVAGNIPPS